MKTEKLKQALLTLQRSGYAALVREAGVERLVLEARIEALESALRPFALFAEKFDAAPIRGIADTLYAIHAEEKAAELRLSDCRKARAALLGEES